MRENGTGIVPRPAVCATALLAVACLAGCGGGNVSAVAGPRGVQVHETDGERVVTAGPAEFANGAVIRATGDGVARVAVGGILRASSGTDGDPPPGTLDLHLGEGTQVRRRALSALDLVAGEVHLVSPPPQLRIVLFHGTTFLEIPTSNPLGVDLTAAADGDSLTVRVTTGDVLLHATGATEKELHFVKLMSGESAIAAPGEKPRKIDPSGD